MIWFVIKSGVFIVFLILAILATILIIPLIFFGTRICVEDYTHLKLREPNYKVVAAIYIGLVIVASLIIWWLYFYLTDNSKHNSEDRQPSELKRITAAQMIVREHLKDGRSAIFKDQYGQCGLVNSKNSFGAYSGFTGFVIANRQLVFFDEEPTPHLYAAAREALVKEGLCR